ncbi:hypothetical protein BC941DRAFT_423461 [Chlamydoabsidia padenii]|nr:hypothetical protein BC941DRAFT_423461 [Chlamydoabsidia padenii]
MSCSSKSPQSPKRPLPPMDDNLDQAKKLKITDSAITTTSIGTTNESAIATASTETTNDSTCNNTSALLSTISKKDRKKYHKAIEIGQNFDIINGKLVLQPKISIRPRNEQVSFNDIRGLVFAALLHDSKQPTWVDMYERNKLKKVVVVDIPVLDPSSYDVNGDYHSLSKLQTPGIHDQWIEKHSDLFKHLGLPQLPGDIFAKVGSGLCDKREGLLDRFSHFIQCKLTKGQVKKLRKDHTEPKDRAALAEELMLTSQELADDGFPMHSSLQDDSSLPDGWVETGAGTGSKKKLVAMDCEMCKSGTIHVLTKVALVDENHKVLLNEFVMPELPITDYVTEYSGVDAKSLEGVTTTVGDIQKRLLEYIDGDTILIGHGLVNDMKIVKMRHPYIIDTSIIYHHDNGPPYRASLRGLSLRYLKRHIQEKNNNDSLVATTNIKSTYQDQQPTPRGHDPCEDAIASMELVQLKMEKGPKFGLHSDFLTETMVERLQQNDKTGVIIDVRPKLKSMLARKLNGHPSFYDMESNAQAIEVAMKQHAINDMVLVKLDQEDADNTTGSDDHTCTILGHVKKMYDCLEPNTVMIMLTGRYDTEELDKLRKKWYTYKSDLRVRSLDEIPDAERWTEDNEQRLNSLLELAKRFYVIPCIKH